MIEYPKMVTISTASHSMSYHMYIYVYVCMYVYIYIYIWRQTGANLILIIPGCISLSLSQMSHMFGLLDYPWEAELQ
jgi:hypothetical protein